MIQKFSTNLLGTLKRSAALSVGELSPVADKFILNVVDAGYDTRSEGFECSYETLGNGVKVCSQALGTSPTVREGSEMH